MLAADISSDHGMVAARWSFQQGAAGLQPPPTASCSTSRRSTPRWVTALEFSPDGVLLASGDRNNGLVVWEAQTGREFFDLRGHAQAITDVCWRLDSEIVLASSSEDGTVRLWEMENGAQIKSWGAHGGGVSSVRFAKDGRLVTTGRDHVCPPLGPERRANRCRELRTVRRPRTRSRVYPRRDCGHRGRLDRRSARVQPE